MNSRKCAIGFSYPCLSYAEPHHRKCRRRRSDQFTLAILAHVNKAFNILPRHRYSLEYVGLPRTRSMAYHSYCRAFTSWHTLTLTELQLSDFSQFQCQSFPGLACDPWP